MKQAGKRVLKITGGSVLNGDVYISGAKNSSLPIMAASLLCKGKTIIKNIPNLADISIMSELLKSTGVKTDLRLNPGNASENNEIIIDASDLTSYETERDSSTKIRASIWLLAPLIHRFGLAKLPLPGGCKIGMRQIDIHLDVLQKMGASLDLEEDHIIARAPGDLKGIDYNMQKVSVGATITTILAAVLAKGITNLTNAAIEPEIGDLCNLLIKMGANIKGIGTDSLTISGVVELKPTEHEIIPDRIEAGTFIMAAAATGGSVIVHNTNKELLGDAFKTLEKVGVSMLHSDNEIQVLPRLKTKRLKSIDASTTPFPGFATDLQAQYMALAAYSSGKCKIYENIYENRFLHATQLNKMGAKIYIEEGKATIVGVDELAGCNSLEATDLRASASLIIAALAAKGDSQIHNLHHLDRGYENIEKKLLNLGAKIKIEEDVDNKTLPI